jgi:cytochrome c peroxidase
LYDLTISQAETMIRPAVLLFAMLSALAGEAAFGSDFLQPPLGLPSLSGQSDSVEAVNFGFRLFFSRKLSADGNYSCASCHDPKRFFSDGKAQSVGFKGRRGTRNAPSLLNSAYLPSLFWDGHSPNLARQAISPLLNHNEQALGNERQVLDIVTSDPELNKLQVQAFGRPVTIDTITAALASYERSLLAGDSPFDRYYFGGERSALSASAVNGLTLFTGRARCASCHLVGSGFALFTDNSYHPSTTTLPPEVSASLPALTLKILRVKARNDDALDQLISDDYRVAALGRFVATLNPADIGMFKTPSLRNVAETAPYMHDGRTTTLREAVERELYVRVGDTNYPIILTSSEQEDLLSFLKALTSPGFQ